MHPSFKVYVENIKKGKYSGVVETNVEQGYTRIWRIYIGVMKSLVCLTTPYGSEAREKPNKKLNTFTRSPAHITNQGRLVIAQMTLE